jgi:hypothetical protein
MVMSFAEEIVARRRMGVGNRISGRREACEGSRGVQ